MASSLVLIEYSAILIFAYFATLPISAMIDADVKKYTVASLLNVPVGKDQHGKDFYKYIFTHHPQIRQYFKGAENFTADDVQKSERFDKQGDAILLSIHVLANTYDNEPVFRAFCRDNIDKHAARGVDPALWKKIWEIWTNFLESERKILPAAEKEAWETLATRFDEESQAQLAKYGLPHL